MKTLAPSQPADASAKGGGVVLHPVMTGSLAGETPPITVPAGQYLDYLSQTALEFVSLPTEADIYQHIAIRLQSLLGKAVVSVCSYEPETRELRQRALVGGGALLDAAAVALGTPLVGFRHVISAEAEAGLGSGRLTKVEGGLYEALLRAVPRTVTRAIEKMTGIREVYGIGCVVGGECLGSILMYLRSDDGMPLAEVVETYVSQAALTLQRRRAEAALRRSEERFRSVMEQAPDAYVVMTTDGTICDLNPGACTATGYTRAALLGRPITDFLDVHELIGKPIQWDRVRRGEVFTDTRRTRRADGSYVTLEARLAPLADGHVLIVARDVTERRRLEKEVVEISRREREAVGRDLHDSLGQQLSGLSLLCAGLRDQLASKGLPEAAEAERIAALLGASVGQTRRIAQGLCLVELSSTGISAALESLADHVSAVFTVNCRYVQDGKDVIPRDATASHLYLIAQEAASNAVRHGRAKSIVIELRTRGGLGQLQIRDDGCGFTVMPVAVAGLGLRIMRYRADMIDGSLAVTSDPTGTRVTCKFPLLGSE
jgi:PAS domain S-box-containing protein